eukprot:6299043-Pyramimonas_sp.AAC.1
MASLARWPSSNFPKRGGGASVWGAAAPRPCSPLVVVGLDARSPGGLVGERPARREGVDLRAS